MGYKYPERIEDLNGKPLEFLRKLLKGLKLISIGKEMGLSESSAGRYREVLIEKYGGSFAQLVVRATKAGIEAEGIEPSPTPFSFLKPPPTSSPLRSERLSESPKPLPYTSVCSCPVCQKELGRVCHKEPVFDSSELYGAKFRHGLLSPDCKDSSHWARGLDVKTTKE